MFSRQPCHSLSIILTIVLAIQVSDAQSPQGVFRQGLNLEEVEIGNLLTWATTTSAEARHFIVQRSADGQHFTTIGQVDGDEVVEQDRRYQFLDLSIGLPACYYRLRCTGEDQKTILTPAIYHRRKLQNSWKIDQMTSTITTAQFNFTMESMLATMLQITLSDMEGQVLLSFPEALHVGGNELSLKIDSLPAGLYRLDLTSAEEHEHLILQKLPPDRVGADGYAIRE